MEVQEIKNRINEITNEVTATMAGLVNPTKEERAEAKAKLQDLAAQMEECAKQLEALGL